MVQLQLLYLTCSVFVLKKLLFVPAECTDLHIVPVEGAFPHDQQVSLRVGRAESLLTEGQEAPGAGEVEQRWDSVRHSVGLLVEKHRPRWEIGRPHALQCVDISG